MAENRYEAPLREASIGVFPYVSVGLVMGDDGPTGERTVTTCEHSAETNSGYAEDTCVRGLERVETPDGVLEGGRQDREPASWGYDDDKVYHVKIDGATAVIEENSAGA